jgi:hypothetical protein
MFNLGTDSTLQIVHDQTKRPSQLKNVEVARHVFNTKNDLNCVPVHKKKKCKQMLDPFLDLTKSGFTILFLILLMKFFLAYALCTVLRGVLHA